MKVFPRWLVVCVTWIDYSLCLPLLAYLPRRWTRPLETLRGWINWRADFDWRTLSLGHGYIRAATERGMARVVQQTGRPASATELCQLTRQRFICTSREELDSWRLKRIDYARLPHHIAGLEHLLTARDQGVGVILAKAHSDSLYIGLALLARAGLTVNLMGTKVIFDSRVPPGIKKHYEQKAEALNYLLAPGKLVFIEDSISFFVKALRRGEIVVIASDGPSSSPDRATPVNFLGEQLLMSSGLEFLAHMTNSPISFYECHEQDHQHFQLRISKPLYLKEGGLQQSYYEMEQSLKANPGRWWAADQYANYIRAASGPL